MKNSGKELKIRSKELMVVKNLNMNMILNLNLNKDLMKIKFDSDDNIPLNKQLKFLTMTPAGRSVFEDDDKFYPQIYLDECLYAL